MSIEIPNDGSAATWHDYELGPVELTFENIVSGGPGHDLRVMVERASVRWEGEASPNYSLILTESKTDPYDMMLGLSLEHGEENASLYGGIEPQSARKLARNLLAAADYIEAQRERSD
jgi:hypothetical protein